MNLAVIPYHDWRKILIEGSRTRDAHFINHFQKSEEIEKLIIINRPITIPELILKKRLRKMSKIFEGFNNPDAFILEEKI